MLHIFMIMLEIPNLKTQPWTVPFKIIELHYFMWFTYALFGLNR